MPAQRKLIKKILVSRNTVNIGESFQVIVKMLPDLEGRLSLIYINGTPGAKQTLQLSGRSGRRKIVVTAYAADGQIESRDVEIDLMKPSPCQRFPIIQVVKDIESRHGVVCLVANAADLGIDSAFCEWSIDTLRAHSRGPQTTIDLGDLIDANTIHQTLTVDLTIHREHLPNDTARRSFTLLNDYAFMKHRKNILQPPTRYDFVAQRDAARLVAHCEVRNLEDVPLHITWRQIEYLYDDPERVSVPEPEARIDTIVIEPKSWREIDCALPYSALPKGAFGFAWHYHGRSEAGHDVAFSGYFEHLTPKAQLRRVTNSHVTTALSEMRWSSCNPQRTTFPLAEVERFLHAKGMTLFPPRTRGGGAPQDAPASRSRRVQHVHVDPLDDMRVFGPQNEGDECLPDQEPLRQDLACQLTDEYAWVYIPARIMNGRKGDTVLSPSGTTGPVSEVLHNVSPPQNYAHTGIMVQNFYALRHSCGSDDWLGDPDALVGKAPIIGDRGTDGIDPDKLKYFWPGTITQSAHEAVNGTFLLDPDGNRDKNGEVKKFRIQAFDFYSKNQSEDGNGKIEMPRVVSPPKRVESNLPKIRDMLHAIAERAKQIDGHYRFYAYTDSAIAFDPTYYAPSRAGWWASGTLPTMCSNFIWLAAKSTPGLDIHLEGTESITRTSDLEPDDVAQSEVDAKTRDGLYFYTAEERANAGKALYKMYYDKAYNMAGFLGTLFTDAPDDVASQICNTFAFDWSGEDANGDHAKNSDKWEDEPTVGRAVSPADILLWDKPHLVGDAIHGLYGYSEPLVYRPARLEFRRISRWRKVSRWGTVEGLVSRRGIPQPQAQVVIGGKDTLSNGHGRFSLNAAAGDNQVAAHYFAEGLMWDGVTTVKVPAGGTVDTVIELKEPPEQHREIKISGAMFFKDEENDGPDVFKDFPNKLFPVYRIGPFQSFAQDSWEEKMGGEIRGSLYFNIALQLDYSIKLFCHLKLYEGASEDTDDLDGEKQQTFAVPKGAVDFEVRMKVTNTDEDDDDYVELVLHVTNQRQP